MICKWTDFKAIHLKCLKGKSGLTLRIAVLIWNKSRQNVQKGQTRLTYIHLEAKIVYNRTFSQQGKKFFFLHKPLKILSHCPGSLQEGCVILFLRLNASVLTVHDKTWSSWKLKLLDQNFILQIIYCSNTQATIKNNKKNNQRLNIRYSI